MYLKTAGRYYVGSEQVVRRAPFLILITPKDHPVCAEFTYAVVRKVALRQLGHFMMGRVRIGSKWYSVSGAYGNDGLIMDVDALPKDAVKLPAELYDAWNKGGGHNSAGSEAPAMREWALKTFQKYRAGGRVFRSLDEAKAYVEDIHRNSGVVLGIEKVNVGD
jgi:hypothetical protein